MSFPRTPEPSPAPLAHRQPLYLDELHLLDPLKHELCDPHAARQDRKSTRLNSSHTVISYAVFCLKKKKPTTVILARRHAGAHSLVTYVNRGLIPMPNRFHSLG